MNENRPQKKLAAATAALSESRERFQVIFDSISDAIFIIDPSSCRALDANIRACEMFGYELEELQRMDIVEVSSGKAPYTQEAAVSWIAKAMKAPVTIEWHARHKSGRLFWVDATLRRVVIGTQEIALVTVRDIDDRKRMEISLQESEYWLKESQRISRMGSYVFDILNDSWSSSSNLDALFGIDRNYPKNFESWGALVHPDDRDRMMDYFDKIRARREPFLAEYRIIRPSDGMECYVEGRGDLVFDEVGNPVKMFGIIHDITEQKRAEVAREESELRHSSLFKNMSEGCAYSRGLFENGKLRDFIYLEVNEAFGTLTGLRDVTGKKVSEVIPGICESNPELFEIYGRVSLTGVPEKFEMEIAPLKVWLSISVYSPKKEHFVAVFDNVTVRKEAEKTLRQLSLATEQSPASVVITNPKGEIEYVNRKFEIVTGYDRAEVIGKNPRMLKSGNLPRDVYENLWKTILSGREWRGEFSNRKKNGEYYWELASINPILNEKGDVAHFVAVKEDISERKKVEAAILESEERFRLITDTIEEVFWLASPGLDRMFYVSPAYEQIWGEPVQTVYDDPKSFINFIHKDDIEKVLTGFDRKKNGQPFVNEYRIVRPDGVTRWINDRGYPVKDKTGDVIRYAGVARDITEAKKLEERFLRAQRMESIGTLAGGVAHDLNNILAPILMGCELLEMDLPESKKKEMLANIKACAERGSEIVKQVLSFARGSEGRRIHVQPGHLIKEVAKIIGETFPKNIRLFQRLDSPLMEVICDPTQIHQVLLNLCVNARDAMPTGGELTLSAGNVEIDENFASMQPGALQGSYVVIKVTDTGTGIPSEIVDRIFDPFFTTKEIGKGTGLGLSTVLGIAKSHDGFVNVYSEPGKGSTFRVYLPAVTLDNTGAAEQNSKDETPRGNGETILIVEDEPLILDATRHVLEKYGYHVLVARDGAEAIAIYVQNRNVVAAVLMDMMMPVMGGLATIHALNRAAPGIKIVATSGLWSKEQISSLNAIGVKHHLVKPYKTGVLLTVINKILHEV